MLSMRKRTDDCWDNIHSHLIAVTRKHFLFSFYSNSEAFSSELLENLEDVFHDTT